LPELPEVETVKKGLERKLKDFIIQDVDILRDSTIAFPTNIIEFKNGIKNSLIEKWDRRGKYLIANLKKYNNDSIEQYKKSSYKNNGYLIIHLRMTGYFNFFERIVPACKHTRVRFFNKNKNELRFIDVRSFGQIWWIEEAFNPKRIIKGLGSLGPEPFSEDFNLSYLSEQFSKRTKSVKSVLLDQTIIAGIGNIYADESLYEAGISPFRSAKTIKKYELVKLRKSIIQVLRKSIGSGGTTFSDFRDIEGSNGNYSMQTKVYRRTGEKCRICKNLIERKKIAGRSTHWCKKCQK
tara:strand:+ start:334 stop:1215 length:882 start_codon:yes stop_codon:yes gene_type:complete